VAAEAAAGFGTLDADDVIREPEVGGAGGFGAEPRATGAAAALLGGGGGAPGGKVGNLIVGAEVGLGGKLMRTVSFFG
jgi:hypothetical protein